MNTEKKWGEKSKLERELDEIDREIAVTEGEIKALEKKMLSQEYISASYQVAVGDKQKLSDAYRDLGAAKRRKANMEDRGK